MLTRKDFLEIRDKAYSFGIGRTPMYHYSLDGSEIYCKLEYRNRYKSIKDRAGFFMIQKGIQEGTLSKDITIIEASSGNTGIAIASIAKDLGYRARIYVPAASSEATKRVLMETGQDIVIVNDEASKRGAINIDYAVSLLKEEMALHPGKYVNFDQYSNEANTLGHYYTTGPESTDQVNAGFTHVVVCIGTGGTVTGLAKYFKEFSPDTKIIAVMPQPYHKIQGLKNLTVSKKPDLLDRNWSTIDEWMDITDDEAISELKKITKLNLFPGLSSAANFQAAKQIASANPGSRILTVFPDSAEKYRETFVQRGIFTEAEYDRFFPFISKDPDGTISYDSATS